MALSSCKEEAKPDASPEAVSQLLYKGKPLDPMCFMLGEKADETVDLDVCTGSAGKDEYTIPENGLQTYDDGGTGYSFKDNGYVFYNYIGKLADGRDIVSTQSSGGGSGQFSDVRSVSIQGNQLINKGIAGGDRCNNGLEGNPVIQDGVLNYSQNITPFDLIELSDGNQAGFKAYEDIEACAICCVATANFKNEALQSITLTQTPEDTAEMRTSVNGERISACLYDVYDEAYRAGKTTLDKAALKEFGAAFNKRCGPLKK